MAEDEHERDQDEARTPLGEEVGRKARRKLRGRGEKDFTVWFGLGMFGLVGWAVAVPTLIGVAIGAWLDNRYPDAQVSWTLTLLFIGIGVGCLNAWYWVKQESERD